MNGIRLNNSPFITSLENNCNTFGLREIILTKLTIASIHCVFLKIYIMFYVWQRQFYLFPLQYGAAEKLPIQMFHTPIILFSEKAKLEAKCPPHLQTNSLSI